MTAAPRRGLNLTVKAADAPPADSGEQRLRSDVEALVALDRRAGSDGERRSAEWIAEALRDIGAQDVAMSGFRTQSSWVPAHVAHLLLGVVAGLIPGLGARLAAAAITASYELDVSGRNHWLRRLLPAGHGVSVTARLAPAGPTRRTVVLVAHHDAAHTGIVWGQAAVAPSRFLARHTGQALPSHGPVLAALATMAVPSRAARRVAGAMLGITGLLMAESMRSPTTPGANDNATGVAAVLELARHLVTHPLPDTEILLVFPGGEEVGNTGMRAWLRQSGTGLDRDRTLVVNLDAVGSHGHLAVARRESLTGRLRAQDVDLALRLAEREHIPLEVVAIPNATDAVAARHAGFRTISLLSSEDGWISNLHRESDTVEAVDWSTVRDAVRLTRRITAFWSDEGDTDV
jgi:hypothetical protein